MPASEECERKDRLRPMRVAHRSQSELFASKLRVPVLRHMPFTKKSNPGSARPRRNEAGGSWYAADAGRPTVASAVLYGTQTYDL